VLELARKLDKNKLVIVESPAKAKTIEKILGSSYKVISSYGHIIDLPKTKIGVDVKDNFKPSYLTIKGKGEVIKKLKEAAKKADEIYLASDPDREGESIAWHIANTLKLDHNEKNRIEFNEITEKAIKEAVKNPRKINISRVNSQQARRILDRLVGYEISPFLWKLISPNTSAGRVQSVALKIICELEDKIKSFVPEKYWDVKGIFDDKYNLNLYKIDDKKIDKLKDERLLERVKKDLKKKYEVVSSKVSNKIKNPPLPLKTSTLQQLASSYLGFSASKTMMVAQKLYEGISINGEHKGLITYMRTDSTRISEEAKEMARKYITKEYGKENVFPRSEAFVTLGILKAGQARSSKYDLSYKTQDGVEYFVEVKAGHRNKFFISPEELDFAKNNSKHYKLFYVFNLNKNEPDCYELPSNFWEDERFKKNEIIEKIEYTF